MTRKRVPERVLWSGDVSVLAEAWQTEASRKAHKARKARKARRAEEAPPQAGGRRSLFEEEVKAELAEVFEAD